MKQPAQVPAPKRSAPSAQGPPRAGAAQRRARQGRVRADGHRRGETLIEYTGERITWKEALRRHPHDPAQPNHTFYFHIDDKHVIDANVDGNAARWINHACDTNCEADEVDGRIFIKATRDIAAGRGAVL